MAVRPPSRASSLPQVNGYIWERLVGWQAAIAGRPALTAGLGASGRVGWLSGRHRWQASSHSWIGCIWERLVGCQAAIAGRPAPTVGLGASGRDWSAGRSSSLAGQLSQLDWVHLGEIGWLVRPPSLAGQLPQLDWVHLGEIGWLAGRHRWQASSHRGMGASGRDWLAGAGQLPQGSVYICRRLVG